MSNFGLLIRALPGLLLSFAILLAVLTIVVKLVSGRWPSISLLTDEKPAQDINKARPK